MEASWEALHPNLLELILDRLPVSDYLRFPAVCPTWHHVQHDHRLHRPPSAPKIPWQMNQLLPKQCIFYNPTEQCYDNLSLPSSTEKMHCCGISHGWLLFIGSMSKFLLLVNPITQSEINIPLPLKLPQFSLPSPSMLPQFSLPNVYGALSSSPTDPDCTVLLWHTSYYFACQIREKNWMHWPISPRLLYDIFCRHIGTIFCGGNIYTNYRGSKLIVAETFPTRRVRRLDMLGQPLYPDLQFFLESDGELLLASVILEQHGLDDMNIGIFKADLSKKVWVRLENLGDRVLFLGDLDSFSLPAAKTEGPGNRIYCSWLQKNFTTAPLWIEYDYETHEVIRKKPQNWGKANESSWFFISPWVVPSLR